MNLEGPEDGKSPGLNPSISLQVGIIPPPVQELKPKFAPARPIKFLTLSLSESPTLYTPSF